MSPAVKPSERLRQILLDTNAYTAYKQGVSEAVEVLRSVDFNGVPVTVMGELLGGFAYGSQFERNRSELDIFLASPRVTLLNNDARTAEFYGSIYANLRTKGTMIPTNDIWIAAMALQHNFFLFTYDTHFKAVEGLRFGSTAAELLG